MPGGGEIRAMTGIRGAAALFVMLYHFEHDLRPGGIGATMLLHGYLSVDLFFILSGFVLCHVYGRSVQAGRFGFGAFLWHRIARIYPVYIAATGAILLLEAIRLHPIGAGMLLSNLVMLQSLGDWPSIDPPAWSVSAELIAYLLFPLSALLCLNGRRDVALGVALLALAAILALSLLSARHWIGSPVARGQLDLFYAPYTIIRCLAGFTIGQYLWRIHDHPVIARWTTRRSVQMAVGGVGLLAIGRTGADFLVYLAIIGLILCLSARQGPLPALFGSGPMHFLGRISFPVYLTHYKAMGVIAAVGGRLTGRGMAPALAAPLALIFTVLLVIGLSWLVHDWVERPARLYMRQTFTGPGSAGGLGSVG